MTRYRTAMARRWETRGTLAGRGFGEFSEVLATLHGAWMEAASA